MNTPHSLQITHQHKRSTSLSTASLSDPCLRIFCRRNEQAKSLSRGVTLFSIQVPCRAYEAQLAAADPSAEAQQQRVRQLFHRQLLVPLADGGKTSQSYQEWEATLSGGLHAAQLPANVEQGFQKAQQAVSLRREHEAMVAADKAADETLLAAYLAYIRYEEVHLLPSKH